MKPYIYVIMKGYQNGYYIRIMINNIKLAIYKCEYIQSNYLVARNILSK